ncbi:MAG: extracellular solute-binding protein [Propionibacteriaceae bacterium]|jgi:multiple sugar transport system substrate-binding protein|nr:extracellular solute-binding protein [Propionibacteriaceae bacterium]
MKVNQGSLKKMTCGAIAAAALLAMSACSPGGSTGKDGSASDAAQGGSSLTMWTFKQSHVKPLQNAAEKFKEKTGVSVTVQAFTPDDAYVTKVQTSAQTGDLPDVMEVHSNGEDFTYGGSGLLTNLADKVDSSWSNSFLEAVRQDGVVNDAYYKQSLAEGSKTAGIQKGERWSVPFTIGTFGIVYANKAKLAAAGVTEAPKTWEAWMADLEKVKAASGTTGGVSIGFQSPTTGLEWAMQQMAFAQIGPDAYHGLFSNDASKNFASANGTKVLSTYAQIQPYWMPGTQSLTIDDADIAFAQGKAAYDIGGTFTLAFLAQNGMTMDDIITFPIPEPSDSVIKDRGLSPFGLTGLSLSASSKNQESALEWMKYLATEEVAAQFAKDAMDVPPVSLGDKPEDTVGPVLGAMIDVFGSDPKTDYNLGDTSYKPGAYDGTPVGNALMELTPLATADVAATGAKMAEIIDTFWSQS